MRARPLDANDSDPDSKRISIQHPLPYESDQGVLKTRPGSHSSDDSPIPPLMGSISFGASATSATHPEESAVLTSHLNRTDVASSGQGPLQPDLVPFTCEIDRERGGEVSGGKGEFDSELGGEASGESGEFDSELDSGCDAACGGEFDPEFGADFEPAPDHAERMASNSQPESSDFSSDSITTSDDTETATFVLETDLEHPPPPPPQVRQAPVPSTREALRRYTLHPPFRVTRHSQVGYGYDRMLHREIVWKSSGLTETGSEWSFLHETLVTARLTHPHILAIYDLVSLNDARRMAVLPRVQGVDLGRHLAEHPYQRRSVSGHLELINLFQQICLAVHHAHSQGIIHCDIKPSNILFAPPGQVYLVDWGLAIDTSVQPQDPPASPSVGRRPRGTVAYAAPEQLFDDSPEHAPFIRTVSTAIDVYGLGALLYHLLCGRAPFSQLAHETPLRFAKRRALLRPTPPRDVDAEVALDLDALCCHCLEFSPERRPSALEVADAITQYLAGRKLMEQRRISAEKLFAQARLQVEALAAQAHLIREKSHEVEQRALELNPFGPRQEKIKFWNLEEANRGLLRDYQRRFSEVTSLLHQAIELDAGVKSARQLLASLYFDRLQTSSSASALSGSVEQEVLEAQVRRLDDGSLREQLDAPALIHLDGATDCNVSVAQVVEIGRILCPQPADPPRSLPVTLELGSGRWMVGVDRPDHLSALYPLHCRLVRKVDLEVYLPPTSEIPDNFAFIPAGPCWMGGDAEAFVSEFREILLPAYAIQRHPVTCQQYLEFLNWLVEHRSEEAVARAPRPPHGPSRWLRDADGHFQLPLVDQEGQPIDPLQPVTLISALDAEAYGAWKGLHDHLPYRLPTENEWEKAGRGADGRMFPWGDRFEQTFCNNRAGRPGEPQLAPIGTFPEDISPYGVAELAGGVTEWTSSATATRRILCGGAWFLHERQCRLARRFRSAPDQVHPSVGFRLCFSVPLPEPTPSA